jgi:outer membrane putative beta-barrel porin/alpha-amylase
MRRIPLAIIAVAALAAAPRAEATCGSTACFLATRTQDGALAHGTFRFDLSYRYVDQSRLREGSSSTDEVLTPGVNFDEGVLEPNHHREIRTGFHVLQADASYGLTGRLSLFASVPLVSAKHHEHVVIEDGEERFTDGDGTTGFGDLLLGARYALLPSDVDLVLVSAAVKLPTGAYKKLDTAGEITEPTLQPGTGSTDLAAALLYSHQIHGPQSEVFLTAGYRLDGTNSLQYRLGDELQAGLGYGRVFGRRWTVNLQVNLRHGARDRYLDEDVPSTGSTLVNVTPGVRCDVTRALTVYAFVPLPLYQRVNEAQLTPKIGVVTGFSRRF